MTTAGSNWRRLFLGVCSIVLIISAIVLLLQENQSSTTRVTAGGCMRIGLLLGAIWLAWPQVADVTQNVPAWMGWTLLGSFVVVVSRPRLIVLVGPLVLTLIALNWAGKFLPRRGKK